MLCSFPEWLIEYEKYGIVLGISIDAKAIANINITPLVSLLKKGCTNGDNARIYAIGIFQDQKTESFEFFLDDFKAATSRSPSWSLPTIVVPLSDLYGMCGHSRQLF